MKMFLFLLVALSGCISIPRTERQALIKECDDSCSKAGKGQCLYAVPIMSSGRNTAILAHPKFWCMADEKLLQKEEDEANRKYESVRKLL